MEKPLSYIELQKRRERSNKNTSEAKDFEFGVIDDVLWQQLQKWSESAFNSIYIDNGKGP
ncbi:MAG: hypothetical protein WBB27_13470 [Maribacter sp.]